MLAYGSVLWNGSGFSQPDDWFAANSQDGNFRPLLTATYRLNRWLDGGWMLLNLGLHIAAGCLLFALTRSIWPSLLFVAHPMAADAVASVAGRSSVLCAVFVLAALVAMDRSRWPLYVILAAAGLAAKPEAAALVLLGPIVLLWRQRYGDATRLLFVGVNVLIVCLIFWSAPLERAQQAEAVRSNGIGPAPRIPAYMPLFLSALGGYVVPSIIRPVDLSVDPDIRYSWPSMVIGIMTLPFTVPLWPYAVAPLPDVFFEHRGYLTIAFMATLATLWIGRPVAILLPLFIVLSWGRCDAYSSLLKLYEDAVKSSPMVARSHQNLGSAYGMAGRLNDAEREFTLALLLNPKMAGTRDNLALVYLRQGQFSKASELLDAGR